MSAQLALAFPDFAAPPRIVGATHSERWNELKQLNPWIVDEFLTMAYQAIEQGHDRIGVKYLTEVYRWERSKAVVGDGFKWNNSHTALLARDLITADPLLSEFIVTRERTAA